jgi:hypothetical protein
MNTSPIDQWEGASSLVPWGPESFGVWLFLVIAIVAFIAMLVRAVQHENEAMVHIVQASHAAERDGKVAEPESAVAAAAAG